VVLTVGEMPASQRAAVYQILLTEHLPRQIYWHLWLITIFVLFDVRLMMMMIIILLLG
jgi:hypothetical protein